MATPELPQNVEKTAATDARNNIPLEFRFVVFTSLDDEQVMYPFYEKAVKAGITTL